MLRAIIFDCDGVIADNEPLHFRCFKRVLEEGGISFTEKEYYDRYLGMDDKGCFSAVLSAHGQPATATRISRLVERKTRYYEEAIQQGLVLFPGVSVLVKKASERYALAVASGALRHEIELILKAAGIQDAFKVIVSAEDVSAGKPDPEAFQKTLARMNTTAPKPDPPILPEECLVLEDSIAGIEAAKVGGMQCLAVTHSYRRNQLHRADLIVDSLEGLELDTLERLF